MSGQDQVKSRNISKLLNVNEICLSDVARVLKSDCYIFPLTFGACSNIISYYKP